MTVIPKHAKLGQEKTGSTSSEHPWAGRVDLPVG
jgi:hypothetical protein